VRVDGKDEMKTQGRNEVFEFLFQIPFLLEFTLLRFSDGEVLESEDDVACPASDYGVLGEKTLGSFRNYC